MEKLDLNFARSFFPALSGEWIYFDNAGGTQTLKQVANRISDYLLNTNVQLGASYDVSVESGSRVDEAQGKWAQMINAAEPSEVAFGSSTTMLMQSLARSMAGLLKPGDEVIVTNCDHEANIGPWIRLQEKGIKVKSWKINQNSFLLDLKDLEKLMTEKTRLVAFTHVSNILGTINPVKEFTRFIHEKGALVCVDGVAYAPHRHIDVQELDVDFYVFSLYKVYGPHYAVLYGKKQHFEQLPGINHFFIEDIPYKLQPGNVNYELSYGILGIVDYIELLYRETGADPSVDLQTKARVVFDLIADHEEGLSQKLLNYLSQKNSVRIIGETAADKNIRVPTVSFIKEGTNSENIVLSVDPYKIGIRFGDFYARRLIDDLGLSRQNGVVRVSLVHYNTIEEVEKLIDVFEKIL